MPNYTCPSCGQIFHADDPGAPCLICGQRLATYVKPKGYHPGALDLARIAAAHRWTIRLLPFMALGQGLLILGPAPRNLELWLKIAEALPTLAMMFVVAWLVHECGATPDRAFLCALTMLIPLANVLVLVIVNQRAATLLSEAGLKVGAWGVARASAAHIMDPMRCRSCGYDLTGNLSGKCPECGTEIPR